MAFFGPDFAPERARTFLRPGAMPHDVLGFRARVADLVGGPEPDVVLGTLSRGQPPGLVVWDGGGPALPAVELGSPPGRSSHFIQGLAAGARTDDARAPLALGDPQFGAEPERDRGRVVLWSLRAD